MSHAVLGISLSACDVGNVQAHSKCTIQITRASPQCQGGTLQEEAASRTETRSCEHFAARTADCRSDNVCNGSAAIRPVELRSGGSPLVVALKVRVGDFRHTMFGAEFDVGIRRCVCLQ